MATNSLCKADRFEFSAQFYPNKLLVLGENYNLSLRLKNVAAQLVGNDPEFSSGEKDSFQTAFQLMKNYQITFDAPIANQLKGRVSFEKFVDGLWVSQGSNLNFSCR